MTVRRRTGILILSAVLAVGIVFGAYHLAAGADRGTDARARQLRVFPVVCRVYADAYDRGVISRKDLRDVTDGTPSCPEADKILAAQQ
jgi:hypothetical protein